MITAVKACNEFFNKLREMLRDISSSLVLTLTTFNFQIALRNLCILFHSSSNFRLVVCFISFYGGMNDSRFGRTVTTNLSSVLMSFQRVYFVNTLISYEKDSCLYNFHLSYFVTFFTIHRLFIVLPVKERIVRWQEMNSMKHVQGQELHAG